MKHTNKTYHSPSTVSLVTESTVVICQSVQDVGNETFEETHINW